MKSAVLARLSAVSIVSVVLGLAAVTAQQQTPSAQRADPNDIRLPPPVKALGDGPWVFDTAVERVRVVRIAKLDHPWSLAFLPDGSMLVTERPGRLRIMRNGVLDPQPIGGVPTKILARGFDGLLDIALHPRFADNGLVYLTYSRPNDDGSVQTALFRARFDGKALLDGKDIFVANSPIPRMQQQNVTSRITFGRDGMLYMTVGAPNQDRLKAQDPTSHRGKILRLKDDGTTPPDNPFVGKSAFGLPYQPEIYSLGHRNAMGLAVNPETGELWEDENGPLGGDEVNVIRAGRNYGWPYISLGREYDGTLMPTAMDGMEQPVFHWSPNPAVTGLMFYTGDKFPRWKNHAFIGGLTGTRLERIRFNAKWEPIGARGSTGTESLLLDLRQRIRDVRQGPDGLIYVLTDETDGAILRLEPAPQATSTAGARQ
jgi:glucose/arabinose dehydrogenase